MYIAELPTTKQNEIKRELKKIGINGIDLQLAMNSKLSDIDYTGLGEAIVNDDYYTLSDDRVVEYSY